MSWIVLAQTTSGDANLGPLVRRLVQGGLGIPPGSSPTLLLMVLAWIVLLLAASAAWQRDWAHWLRGFADIRGHFEQLGSGLDILRRNKRPLWVVLAGAVLSWTCWALRVWSEPAGKDELEAMLVQHENSAAGFAAWHALAAAIVPLRDWLALGDFTPLALGTCIVLFARTSAITDHLRQDIRPTEGATLKRRVGTIWVALIVLSSYRLLVYIVSPTQAPMADCLYLNSVLVPGLTIAADAMLLSWVLTEFARGVTVSFDWQPADTVVFMRNIPVCMVACVLANFGRYMTLTAAIWQSQTSPASNWPASRWGPILWIALAAQLTGLIWFGLPAVIAVTRYGGIRAVCQRYLTLLRRAGGRLAGLACLGVALNFALLVPIYWMFGTMQRETWSLLGAASYGHYMSLLIGIVLLAGTTQLAYRELGLVEEPQPVGIPIEPLELRPAAPIESPSGV